MDTFFAIFTSSADFTKKFRDLYREQVPSEMNRPIKYPTPGWLTDIEENCVTHYRLDRTDPVLIKIVRDNNGQGLIEGGFITLVSIPNNMLKYIKMESNNIGIYETVSLDIYKYLAEETKIRLKGRMEKDLSVDEAFELVHFMTSILENPPLVKELVLC